MYYLEFFIFLYCLSNGFATQCDSDETYTHYKHLIQNEKENIFDTLLDEYGDVDKELENLLIKLSEIAHEADQNLSDFEMVNKNVKEFNNELDARITAKFKELKDLEDQIDKLNVPDVDRNLFNEDILPFPDSIEKDLNKIEKDLSKWRKIIEEYSKSSLANDIMNIPYSLSDEITFLETTLLDEEVNTDCLNKFHQDLKTLFTELSTLLNFSDILSEIEKIQDISNENTKDAKEILKETKLLLEKEKKLMETCEIANNTLKLAEEVEKLKKEISQLSNEKFPHKEKIDMNELEALLEELQRYEEYGKFDIDEVEKQIQQYSDDTECFLKYIDRCHIRKPTENFYLPECVKKVCFI